MRIHYQEITSKFGEIYVPTGSRFMTVESAVRCRIYYEANVNAKGTQEIKYSLVETGNLPPNNMTYYGTYVTEGYNYVAHLYMSGWDDDEPKGEDDEVAVAPPTTVLAEDHKGLSFIYRKGDGTTRLVRLSRYIHDVSGDGRQYLNGLDAERDSNFRTFYLDQIVEWAQIG